MPTASPITFEEYEALVARCRSLPPAGGLYLETDFVTNLVVTVIDFQQHTRTVERAMTHFNELCRPHVATIDDLEATLADFPDDKDGNTALAQHLWGYNLWTRAAMLRGLVAYFVGEAVRSQEGLAEWASRSTFKDFEGKVKGLGPAVYNWLVMRQGVETVKPDVHVLRFAERVIGRRLPDREVVDVLVRVAHDLGIKAYELDWRIWEYQQSQG